MPQGIGGAHSLNLISLSLIRQVGLKGVEDCEVYGSAG